MITILAFGPETAHIYPLKLIKRYEVYPLAYASQPELPDLSW